LISWKKVGQFKWCHLGFSVLYFGVRCNPNLSVKFFRRCAARGFLGFFSFSLQFVDEYLKLGWPVFL